MFYNGVNFDDKCVLITGGAGFIGSNLAFYFQENYPRCKVVVFDRFRDGERFPNGNPKSYGHFKNLIGFKGIVISGDITNKDDLQRLKEYKFDYIFHEAAISDTTIDDQKIMIDTNVNAFTDILKMAKEMKSSLIYASSAATYGDSDIFKVGYEKPNNAYGFSKLMMDNIAREYMKDGDIDIVGLRYFNVYGEREYYKGKTASMILQFGLQLLKGSKAKLFVGSDEIKRDFVYIEDVIQANIKACKPKKSGIYNVGTGEARSFQKIVDILKFELDIDREDSYIVNPYKKQYQYFTQADISLTREFLEYNPSFSLEKGIRTYLPEIRKIAKR